MYFQDQGEVWGRLLYLFLSLIIYYFSTIILFDKVKLTAKNLVIYNNSYKL